MLNKSRNRLLALSVLAAAGVWSSDVIAAPIFNFEDPAILNAITPPTTSFSLISQGLTATFAGPSTEPDAFQISFNSASGPFPAPYSTLADAFLGTADTALNRLDALTIRFSQPVQSVSLNFALGDRAGSLSLTTDAGGTGSAAGALTPRFAYAEGTLSFSGAAFQTLTLRTAANGFAIDNVAVTVAAAAVPEPGTLLLLGAGLAGAAMTRRHLRA